MKRNIMVKPRLLKKIVISILIFMIMAIMCGCGSEFSTNGNSSNENTADKINIKFSSWQPATSDRNKDAYGPALEELKNKSNGRVEYTTYYGASLGEGEAHYEIVKDGLSDMGYFTATWTPGLFPLTDVLSMPSYVESLGQATDIANAMHERILNREFTDVKMLQLNGCVQSYIFTKKPVHNLEDLKDLRIRTSGGLQTYMLESLGAQPVFMPLGDVYMSVETGVLDGIVTCIPMVNTYNLYEVLKNVIAFSFGCVAEGVVMNSDSWEKMPSDIQSLIEEIFKNPFNRYQALTKEILDTMTENLKNQGVAFNELSSDEHARWNEIISEEVVKKWVEDMEAKGLPGKETILIYKAELDKHGAEFPSFPSEWEEEVEGYK